MMKTQSLTFLPANKTAVQGILSPLAIALGVALPHVFHLAGIGPVYLPMFLPLILVAMTMELPFVLLVAITTPLISHAMTGMPAQGTAIVIAFQLSFLGLCGWFFRTRGKVNYLWAIVGSVAAERVVSFLAGLALPSLVSSGAVIASYPGVIFLLVASIVLMKIYDR
jgi:niacin transporter